MDVPDAPGPTPWARLVGWLLLLVPAVAMTTGDQSCEPAWSTVLGLGVAATVALVAGLRLDGWSGRLSRVTSLALVALMPISRMLTYSGMPFTRDGSIHLWNAWSAANAILRGDTVPRWLDGVGLGLPVGQFYPPIAYAFAAWPMAAGAEPRDVMMLVGWSTGLVGALGVYAVLRDLGWERAAAMLGGAVFIVAPYRLFDVTYRFALGELLGLALVLPFWHLSMQLVRGARGPVFRRPVPVLWLLGTALALGHPQSLLMAGLLLVPMVVWAWGLEAEGGRGWRGPALLVLAAGLVVGSATFHLAPAFVEQRLVQIDEVIPSTPTKYAQKGLTPYDGLTRRRWSDIKEDANNRERGRTAWGRQRDWGNTPFYLGWTLFGALPLVLVAAARGDRTARQVGTYVFAAAASFAATITPVALVMGELEILYPLQFPWRFLGPATLGLVVLLVAFLRPLLRGPRAPAVVVAVVAAVAWDAAPGLGAASWMGRHDPGIRFSWYAVESGPPTCPASDNIGYHAVPIDLQALLAEAPVEVELSAAERLRAPIVEGAPWMGYPTGDLPARVVGARMPPRRVWVDVANVQPVPLEFHTQATRERFWSPLRDNEDVALLDAGVDLVFPKRERGAVRRLPAWPRVRLQTRDGLYGVAAKVWRNQPREIGLTLPEGVPEGRLILVEQAFPGWSARVDDGPWSRARVLDGLLSVDIPDGTRAVRFRYSASTDLREGALWVSTVSWGMGLLVWFVPWVWRRWS